jgi:hypothetical protein
VQSGKQNNATKEKEKAQQKQPHEQRQWSIRLKP